MRTLNITENGNITLVQGKGINLDIVGEEMIESIDLSSFSEEEWKKIENNIDEISQNIAK